MGFQLLDTRELHDRVTNVLQTLLGEVGAGDVLDIRAKVDTRILLSVSECCC
jgi:hypothetical protein